MKEEEHPLLSISEFVLGQKVLAKHFKICHISYLYEISEKGGFFCWKNNNNNNICIFVNYKKWHFLESSVSLGHFTKHKSLKSASSAILFAKI